MDTGMERFKKYAKTLLDKVIPFEIWCKIEPRSESQKEMYWSVVKGLEKTAKEGWPKELKCKKRD